MAIGDIIGVIASLEFDTGEGAFPSITHVSGDVYAIAYQGVGEDGWLKTVSISDDGLTLSVIASLEFDTGEGAFPSITHISGNVYAIAYFITGAYGWLKTVSISDDGLTLSVIASIEYDGWSGGYYPVILHVSGNVYAIVYYVAGYLGWLTTVSISDDGATLSAIASLQYGAVPTMYPSSTRVSGNVYAIAYQGWLKTVSISDDGLTLSLIASLEFDTVAGAYPSITHVSGNVYAIAYRGPDNDGWLKTVSISDDGLTLSLIASLEFDTESATEPHIIHVSGNVYAIAYQGPYIDGWLRTVSISDDGLTLSLIASLEFDTGEGAYPSITHVSGDVYAIAYQGVDEDGWLKTVSIETVVAPTVTMPGLNPAFMEVLGY